MPNETTILLISTRQDRLTEFTEALQTSGEVTLTVVTTFDEAIQPIADAPPSLIVVDERVGDLTGIEVVRRLMEVNAFIDTAVLSSLKEEDFHRHSEGLGIRTRLAVHAGKKDASELLDILRQKHTVSDSVDSKQ